jgi:hypothetical protein
VKNTKKKVLKNPIKSTFATWYLIVFILLKPSWYIIGNLSDSKKNDILPGFQTFLLEKKLAPESMYSFMSDYCIGFAFNS